ncbi:MAG: class I SAM-dependent methyltransferase [Pseudomonadota bacterium]
MTNACRYCSQPLTLSVADLGATPLANSYLPVSEEAKAAERSYPLHVMVCQSCRLTQTTETVPADAIFDHDYAYLSSYSASWVAHAQRYAEAMTQRFDLGPDSLVTEVASNDGYLLQHFVGAGIPVLGIEPAGHAAALAEKKGVRSRVAFFNEATARELVAEGFRADLMAGNNVLAHVPDIRDFAAGFPVVLKPGGVLTFEFPHLLNLIDQIQFDTIYHEHYSYLSLLFVERLLDGVGMRVFDVEELPTHGGSLRIFACHKDADHLAMPGLQKVRVDESNAALDTDAPYAAFGARIESVCQGFRSFLAEAVAEGKTVAAYGAAAKGNTFLNVCKVGNDKIAFVVDRNPEKQDRLLPGSHIPVHDTDELKERQPDYVVILPWNLAAEISEQHAYIADWGGKFVIAVPEIRVL